MRLIAIFFVFAVAVGPRPCSGFFLGSLSTNQLSTTISDIVNKLCPYFAMHPDRAAIGLQALNSTLQRTETTRRVYSNTIAYINGPEALPSLVGGNVTCPLFFNGFKTQLESDINREYPQIFMIFSKIAEIRRLAQEISTSLNSLMG